MKPNPVIGGILTQRLTRIPKLWIGLGMVYAALLAWHQPLRGPLTETEVRAAFGEQFEQIQSGENLQALALLDFFLTDDGLPFHMLNLNALSEQTTDTDKAAQTYGAFMVPRLLARASYPVLMTDVIIGLTITLGPDVASFERLVVVRYRSRRDFLKIIATPEFREAVRHKSASLDGWYAAPSSAGATLSIPQLALIALITVGGFGTLLLTRRHMPPARQVAALRNT